MRPMRALLLLLAILLCSTLNASAEPYTQPDAQASTPAYTLAAGPNPDDYPSRQAYEERRKRVLTNCNMGWSNCSSNCNRLNDPYQRAHCTNQCNAALINCINNF